ncbi:hypothetical protein glysoja_012282 [Glycine soja]|nr:hypothetical protein glysoja_012282 [Glycine soja]
MSQGSPPQDTTEPSPESDSLEFSAEEFETALLTPNDTLGDIHVPLLKVGAF